jgi:hypothetical protein
MIVYLRTPVPLVFLAVILLSDAPAPNKKMVIYVTSVENDPLLYER